MSRRRSGRKRDDETERCRLATKAAAELPVWNWWLWAEAMTAEGGGDRADWLQRMAGFRPWRDHPDGRRDRWSVADEAARLDVGLDDVVLLHAVRWWGGYVSWDPKTRSHRMQPNAWPDRFDGRDGFSPRLCDEEILEAAGEVRAALGWLSDALRRRDAVPMAFVAVPTLLRTVADCERAIGIAEDELVQGIRRVGEAADLVECSLR